MPFYDNLLTFLEICNNKSSKSIICSDTNIDSLKHSKESVYEYNMNILSTGFYHLNHWATSFSNKDNFSLIDHIITNDKPKNTKFFQNVQSISDHNIIFFSLSLDCRKDTKKQETLIRNFSEKNIALFKKMYLGLMYSCQKMQTQLQQLLIIHFLSFSTSAFSQKKADIATYEMHL